MNALVGLCQVWQVVEAILDPVKGGLRRLVGQRRTESGVDLEAVAVAEPGAWRCRQI